MLFFDLSQVWEKRNLSKQDDKAIALCSYQDKSNSLQFKMAPSFIQNNLSLQY